MSFLLAKLTKRIIPDLGASAQIPKAFHQHGTGNKKKMIEVKMF